MKKRSFWNNILLTCLDALCLAFAFWVAYWIRFELLIDSMPGNIPTTSAYIKMSLFALLLWLVVFKLFNIYEKRFLNLVDELALIFVGLSAGAAFFLGSLYLYKEFSFSRQVLMYVWSISLVLLVLIRLIFYFLRRAMLSRGLGIKRTLIFGAGEIGQSLGLKMKNDPALGYRIIGFIDDDPVKQGKEYGGIKVWGESRQLKGLIQSQKIDEVVVAVSNVTQEKILDLITECETVGVGFKLVPGLLEILASRVDIDEVGGLPLVTIEEVKWQGLKAWIKRGTDIIFSLIIILVLSPLFLIVALIIKLDSRGPVFFAQERVGKEGQLFKMLKFRSMVKDAEILFPQLKDLSEVGGHVFKMREDPRITRVGRWLRRYSIDELPQLFNVLLGEMSLVGPRPPLPREVKDYNHWHLKRLRIAPGITGLWQVSGRSEVPFEEMVRLDIYYIENWSLWLDLKILFRTLPAVLRASGAY